MDQTSQARGRMRLVPVAGGRGPRTEAGVRRAQVKAARARVAAGFYDRAEVREKLLDAILDELTDP